jgi:peroxiredoxin family protein
MGENNRKCSIVVMSGDMDRVMGALIIATGAAASGMETSMFFTFWGLNAIRKEGIRSGEGLLGKAMGLLNKGGIENLNPSKFSFGGLGRRIFKKMMKQKNVASLPQLLEMAVDLDVKLIACKMSMDVMEITEDVLIDEVSEIAGVATFVQSASNSEINLFI